MNVTLKESSADALLTIISYSYSKVINEDPKQPARANSGGNSLIKG